MCNDRPDVDLASFYQSQRPSVYGRTPVRVKPAGRTYGSNDCRFPEHNIIQDTQINASVTMTVQQHSCLLLYQSRRGSKHLPSARGFDKEFHPLSSGQILYGFNKVSACRVQNLINAKFRGQLTLERIRLAYDQPAFIPQDSA